jgi:hypothetical protein
MSQTAAENQEGQIQLKDVKFEYVDLLNNNNIQISDLPVDIRKKINALKPHLSKYQTSGNDSYYQAMVKLDYQIVEMIGDFIDKDLPDEEEYNKTQQTQQQAAASDEPPATPIDDETQKKVVVTPEDDEAQKKEAAKNLEKEMVETIIAKINSVPSKVITMPDLISIVGKEYFNKNYSSWNKRIIIHNTKFVQLFQRTEFKLG